MDLGFEEGTFLCFILKEQELLFFFSFLKEWKNLCHHRRGKSSKLGCTSSCSPPRKAPCTYHRMCFLASSRQMSIPLSIQLLYLGMGLVNRAQTSTEQRWDLSLVLGLALSLQHFLVRNCINVTITLLKDREICFGMVKEPSAKGEKSPSWACEHCRASFPHPHLHQRSSGMLF